MTEFYLLGAGRPHIGDGHTALRKISNSSQVIDWLLHAVNFLDPKCFFVCGYQADAIKDSHPNLNYIENKEWEVTKSGWSLLTSLSEKSQNTLVSYSDIVFRESVVKKMLETDGDIVVTVDSQWRSRYLGRAFEDINKCEKVCISQDRINILSSNIDIDIADAEFIGLVYFSKKANNELIKMKSELGLTSENLRQATLSHLIELLRIRGLKVTSVDVNGDWAQLNEEPDLAKFILGTKAQTLNNLKKIIKLSQIEDQIYFSVGEWNKKSKILIKKAQDVLGKKSLIVRSSALSEDGFLSSSAGMYTSILNVSGSKPTELKDAVNAVIKSYPDNNLYNEVLIQPMLSDVLISGVVFTRGLQNGAPYYTINYDDTSGSTESITSGTSQDDKTLIIRRDASPKCKNIPNELINLLPAIREIEELLNYDSLDIEFAITEKFGIHILQVRPITVEHSLRHLEDQDFYSMLNIAEDTFNSLQKPSPFVLGDKALFGVMPDWNPAEIIGTKPNILATSLYSHLILNEIWAQQRAEYGYRDVNPQALLISFAGHPYIDIRASFNSFIPKKLPKKLAHKLINFSLEWLKKHPELHDKVEFDVIPTCFDLDFSLWEKRFISSGKFSQNEVDKIKKNLLEITNKAFHRNDQDLENIKTLEKRFLAIKKNRMAPLEKAFLLLEDAKLYGTLPFSHLARSAFIAIGLLRSGVATGVLTEQARDDFLNSIHTVSQEFTDDSIACSKNKIEWEEFVEKYGHLRPGTYDITSPNYSQNAESYLKPIIDRAKKNPDPDPNPNPNNNTQQNAWLSSKERFFAAMNFAGLQGNPGELENFFKTAIEGREYAKFAFTRNLSLALSNIEVWGQNYDLDIETLSHLSIEDLRMISRGVVATSEIKGWVENRAIENKKSLKIVDNIELPPLITSKDDFSVFLYPKTFPNFIGNCKIIADCMNLENINAVDETIEGKIILIPQADPGYDWLFGRNIAGLITMYGGANSHMAIRAAEFGLPAAIGIGETLYRNLCNQSKLELNPGQRIIRNLS